YMYSFSALRIFIFLFSSRRRHTSWPRDWSSDVCSSDLDLGLDDLVPRRVRGGVPDHPVQDRHRFGAVLREGIPARDAEGAGVPQIGRASCRERVEITMVGG